MGIPRSNSCSSAGNSNNRIIRNDGENNNHNMNNAENVRNSTIFDDVHNRIEHMNSHISNVVRWLNMVVFDAGIVCLYIVLETLSRRGMENDLEKL